MKFRALPAISLVSFVLDGSSGITSLAMPLLLKNHYKFSEAWVGIILGTCAFGYILTSMLGGKWADRVGATVMLRAGSLLVTIGCLGFCLFESTAAFLTCCLLTHFGHGFFWSSFQAWFGQGVSRRETARRVGIFSVSWSLGLSAAGPLLGGYLLEFSPLHGFLGAGLLAAGTFLFYQFLRPELPREVSSAAFEADAVFPREVRSTFLAWSRVANLMAVFVLVVHRNFLALLCNDWGMSPSTIGILLMTLGISHSGTFLVLSLTHRWHFRPRYLFAGQILGMVGLLVLGIGGSFWMPEAGGAKSVLGISLVIVALLGAGAMAGICFMSSAFYALFGQEDKGKNSGINEGIIGSAGVLSLYGGGAAVALFGNIGPYWLSAALIGVSLLVQARLHHPATRKASADHSASTNA